MTKVPDLFQPAKSAVRVTRDVTIDECWWLPMPVVAEGTLVYPYYGPTYGCIDHSAGRAVSLQPGEPPCFQMPYDALGDL